MMNWVVRLNLLHTSIKSKKKKKSVDGTVVSLKEGRNYRRVYLRKTEITFKESYGIVALCQRAVLTFGTQSQSLTKLGY